MSTLEPAESDSHYLLLFRGTDWDKGLSPAEIQAVMHRLMAWFERLQQQGQLMGGQPLGEEGRILSGTKGRTVADGPFSESKEAVGGYLLLHVSGMDEAVAIARSYPCLDYGASVEVRPIVGECPTFQRAKAQLAQTTA